MLVVEHMVALAAQTAQLLDIQMVEQEVVAPAE
jgi:hypothetical protein